MFNRRAVVTACGAAILTLVMAALVDASINARRTTYLTFSGPVALPGVTLGRGTYIFELADSTSRLDLVRVLSRDRSQVYLTAFTNMIARPSHLPVDRFVSLGEAPAGVAPPIVAWYPPGDSNGREFVYRK
jgi:hypothetical protein